MPLKGTDYTDNINSHVFCVDLAARKMYIDGRRIDLEMYEFLTVKLLVENADKSVSRERIAEMWHQAGYTHAVLSYGVVTRRMAALKAKVEGVWAQPIRTVWGVGFMWASGNPTGQSVRGSSNLKLPLPDTTCWGPRRKERLLLCIKGNILSLEDAQRRYNLSETELETWSKRYREHGVEGLRARFTERSRS